jgi:hypothetical protein
MTAMKDQPTQRTEVRWKRPMQCWMKINTNGSFVRGTSQGAGVAVIRNHEGTAMAAQARWYGPI